MQGPKVVEALARLHASTAPRDAFILPGTWHLDEQDRVHGPGHDNLPPGSLRTVRGDLDAFLRSKRCNRKSCRSLVEMFGAEGAAAVRGGMQ